MALHADFAAAVSISRDFIQEILHAAYVNKLLPARLPSTTPLPTSLFPPGTSLTNDLFLSEPQLILEAGNMDAITIAMELMGSLSFQSKTLPPLTCEIHSRTTVAIPLTVMKDVKTKTLQFGLNIAKADFKTFETKRTKGSDPNPIYKFDLNSDYLKMVAKGALLEADKAHPFTISPPMLGPLMKVGYPEFVAETTLISEIPVRVSDTSVNIGIDVAGLTKGDPDALVDLNTISTDKGWSKVYAQQLPVGDDEYGEPMYETKWTGTTLRSPGPHGSSLAVSLNVALVNDIYDKIGRYEVFKQFADDQYKDILDGLKALKDKKATSYSPSDFALVVINSLDVALDNKYLKVDGSATKYGDPASVSADFNLQLRPVLTGVMGVDPWLSSHQDMAGLTGEIRDLNIEEPSLITWIEIIGLVVGLLAAPYTSGISILGAVYLDIVISSMASVLIGNAEHELGRQILDQLSSNQGSFSFTLPNTEGPIFNCRPDDIVVSKEGITGWLDLTDVQYKNRYGAWLSLVGYPGDVWPTTDRNPIAVEMRIRDDGLYNSTDTQVRIRWEVFGDSTANKLFERNSYITPAPPPFAIDPKRVVINHASAALDGYDFFIVNCRVYRPWADWTQEIFQSTIKIRIADRLLRTHPYVKWDHGVFYMGYSAKKTDPKRHQTNWVQEMRQSKIHYTDPAKRCRFADRYSAKRTRESLIYMDNLPFDIADIDKHRKQVCSYCFFGGPKKSGLPPEF